MTGFPLAELPAFMPPPLAAVNAVVKHADDRQAAKQDYLRRWTRLLGVGVVLLFLLSSLIAIGGYLHQQRQGYAELLQGRLLPSYTFYHSQLALQSLQARHWHTKHTAIQQWIKAKRQAIRPWQYLLQAQGVAQGTDASIDSLAWQAGQGQLTLTSQQNWPVIRRGLDELAWVDLIQVQQQTQQMNAASAYVFAVAIDGPR